MHKYFVFLSLMLIVKSDCSERMDQPGIRRIKRCADLTQLLSSSQPTTVDHQTIFLPLHSQILQKRDFNNIIDFNNDTLCYNSTLKQNWDKLSPQQQQQQQILTSLDNLLTVRLNNVTYCIIGITSTKSKVRQTYEYKSYDNSFTPTPITSNQKKEIDLNKHLAVPQIKPFISTQQVHTATSEKQLLLKPAVAQLVEQDNSQYCCCTIQ